MYIVIFVTASNKKEAQKIAVGLIKHKLAACVNIVDKVDSLFFGRPKFRRLKNLYWLLSQRKKNYQDLLNW